ncbi:unnamed protein product, partial [Heterosigma akashiwo]
PQVSQPRAVTSKQVGEAVASVRSSRRGSRRRDDEEDDARSVDTDPDADVA